VHCSNSISGWLCNHQAITGVPEAGEPTIDDGFEAGADPMYVLLLLPFIGLLWVPFYNFLEPSLFGFPFFYWYQLAWVPVSSFLIWLVYRSRPHDDEAQ
jgi:hypothetical protein